MAAALFRYGKNSYAQYEEYVRQLPLVERQRLACSLLGSAEKFDVPLRELEHTNYTFELVMDQGAFFEFKRHRMMTLTAQPLTTSLGYITPRTMVEAGLKSTFQQVMEQVSETYAKLYAFNPEVASYVVPNAFNRRLLFTLNLRSADHLISLRSAPNAHFSIRRIAHRLADEMRHATPLLGSCLRETGGETWQDVEAKFFA